MKYKIGVGITTHNRFDIFYKTYETLLSYPDEFKLIVVDDASDKPNPYADYRFETNVGIATAKNKCLELLEDCDHIFLFDDDCYPTQPGWYLPYVESPEPHLCYIFKDFKTRPLNDCKELYRDDSLVGYTHARGCMMYFKKIVLDTVGGFDMRHKRWGGEHIQLSDRIHNVGLTTFRYQDIPNSGELFYSGDEHEAVEGTVPVADRKRYLLETAKLRAESKTATHYCDYHIPEPKKRIKGSRDVIICAYLTGKIDIQRKEQWKPDYDQLKPLINSCKGQELIVINDCFDKPDTKNLKFISTQTVVSPYWQRWIEYYRYLRDHPDVNNVFIVDATDVELLHNPFSHLKDGILYLGDEEDTLASRWLLKMHRAIELNKFFRRNSRKPLLNCGVVGGNRELIIKFCQELFTIYFDNHTVGETEMGAFNYLAYTRYENIIEHGRHITTRFKKEEYTNAWFKHK